MILVWVVAVCVGRERIIDWGLTSASAVPGPPWLLGLLFGCGGLGLLSRGGAQAPPYAGFCYGAQAPGHGGSQQLRHVGSAEPRML